MSKYQTLREVVENTGKIGPISSVSEFIDSIREVSDTWQQEDHRKFEEDEDELLNIARIVGQVWFRGHETSSPSLRPGLYRKSTWKNLVKKAASPKPIANREDDPFEDLFDLEHAIRIDFTSYGHLLNDANQVKSAMDWYFMMQHHAVPTRLLDWTTNGLAALFFAVDGLRNKIEQTSTLCGNESPELDKTVAVWMIDAYWLAMVLSENTWSAPLLPWSEDAAKYVPDLVSLVDKNEEVSALIPDWPMPIEPPAIHPRVAAQEGRFIIFGKRQDLLDVKIDMSGREGEKPVDLRVRQILFAVSDPDALLRDLAQLGVSKRTLFPDLGGLAEFVRWKHLHKVRYP